MEVVQIWMSFSCYSSKFNVRELSVLSFPAALVIKIDNAVVQEQGEEVGRVLAVQVVSGAVLEP